MVPMGWVQHVPEIPGVPDVSWGSKRFLGFQRLPNVPRESHGSNFMFVCLWHRSGVGYPWISMDGHCYLWISQDIRGFAWNQDSFDPVCVTLGSHWGQGHFGISLVSHWGHFDSRWGQLGVHENPWISMRSVDIHGTIWIPMNLWNQFGSLWDRFGVSYGCSQFGIP